MSQIITSSYNKEGKTLAERFLPPAGYERIIINKDSFGYYLRTLPLKPANSMVKLYNGTYKRNNDVYLAVVDLKIGNKNLHQCADAVIHLRAEYLYKQKRFKDIHFNLTNGFRVDYSEWMAGKRIMVKGNKTWWIKRTAPANTYSVFWEYLEFIFTYAGTQSLSKELKPRPIKELQPGDVFIKGGSPGHAVIVVDVCENKKTGKRLFMLAQSYMPAQEIQILTNPNNKNISPWYAADIGDTLITPEWVFGSNELKQF